LSAASGPPHCKHLLPSQNATNDGGEIIVLFPTTALGDRAQSGNDRAPPHADVVRWMRALGWVKENICAGVDTSLSQGSVENVKNITVTVDDETYRRARIKAAERDTSVSALVARFLTELATGETDTERLKREERALRERIGSFRAADRLARDDVHRRDL
jgi:hypothetical protein